MVTLYHTPSGKFWHMDPQCRRVLRWQWPRLKAYDLPLPSDTADHIRLELRCKGCWR